MSPKDRRIRNKTDDSFYFEFERRSIQAWPGETVAGALIANGDFDLRSAEDTSSRGVLCSIGVCWECRCIIDGQPNRRACMTEAKPGMVVRRQQGLSPDRAAASQKQ